MTSVACAARRGRARVGVTAGAWARRLKASALPLGRESFARPSEMPRFLSGERKIPLWGFDLWACMWRRECAGRLTGRETGRETGQSDQGSGPGSLAVVRGLGSSARMILLSFAGGRERPSGRLPPK